MKLSRCETITDESKFLDTTEARIAHLQVLKSKPHANIEVLERMERTYVERLERYKSLKG